MNELDTGQAAPVYLAQIDEPIQTPAELPIRALGVGYRMMSVEIFNWGTFDSKPRKMHLGGQTALLTGNIGSGKSTLVDAITTLLFPAQRIAYNKAAGAESKERDLRSYVLGSYKSEHNEATGTSRPVSLRNGNTYSVIIGVFHNSQLDKTVSLAVALWIKDGQYQPEKLYACAPSELSVKTHFSGFGTEISGLKKHMRTHGIKGFDNFKAYSGEFKRQLGIESEQALDLFHQTVSMKSVGNLTQFTRAHMLRPSDTNDKIEELIGTFDDLNRSHEHILKAKRQIAMLAPIAQNCAAHRDLSLGIDALRAELDSLPAFISGEKIRLLSERSTEQAQEKLALDANIATTEDALSSQRNDESEIRDQLFRQGGGQIEILARQISDKQIELQKRRVKSNNYHELAEEAGLSGVSTQESFLTQRAGIQTHIDAINETEGEIHQRKIQREVEIAQARQMHAKVVSEIAHLNGRKNNIPADQVGIRKRLCDALSLDEEDLPFAGELIQVKESERKWEGAIERVLHSFGLSLLVPDLHYASVQEWIDRTALGGKLVFYHIGRNPSAPPAHLHPNSLVRKLDLDAEGATYDWLDAQLCNRFDLACCASNEQFQREKKALTVKGQIKSKERHEKDDRRDIHNRAHYILGFSTAEKIEALKKEQLGHERAIQNLLSDYSKLDARVQAFTKRKNALHKLGVYESFQEMDWQSTELDILTLSKKKADFEQASDALTTLREQLAQMKLNITAMERDLERLRDARSRLSQRLQDDAHQIEQAKRQIQGVQTQDQVERLTVRIETLFKGTISLDTIDEVHASLRRTIEAQFQSEYGKSRRLGERIVNEMSSYKSAFPSETRNVDASIDASPEYERMLKKLEDDDLPALETRFKSMLNKDIMQGMAVVASRMNSEEKNIHEKIQHINQSLKNIEYNYGRYIQIEARLAPDSEVRDFKADLKACTEGAVSGFDDSQFAETKFHQIKKIVDRLRGREGQTDQDKAWRNKVVDVRNWFVFGASERYKDNDEEHEHYSDSGGKSGGQKEKLAYTILAAGLAYQFGVNFGEKQSKGFRFVVIDEAFGRGSDDSTRYGLELFERFGLQLLIVTPLQKIEVIEPYVSHVCLISNDNGKSSQLQNITIAEHLARRQETQ